MKPRLLRPAYFAWIVVPATLYAAYATLGLPHLVWSYDYANAGASWSNTHFTRCTYLGPYGAITIRPADGSCAWVAFFKSPASTAR
jgi:hypothetical protein